MPPETCLMTIGRCITCFAVILLVAGCSASGGGGATAGATSVAPQSAVPSATVVGVVPSVALAERAASGATGSAGRIGVPAATIAPVVVDAAGRAGVTPDQVKVVSAESMTFPDGGLGCPEPGMAYTQMVVDGFKIVVEANGTTFDYRGTANGFRLCSKTPS